MLLWSKPPPLVWIVARTGRPWLVAFEVTLLVQPSPPAALLPSPHAHADPLSPRSIAVASISAAHHEDALRAPICRASISAVRIREFVMVGDLHRIDDLP